MKLRINIKALCRFRFPTKKAIKNLAKFSEKNWVRILRGC